MKKRIILVLIVFIISNCEIKVRESKAQTINFVSVYNKEIIIVNDMEYMLLYVRDNTSQTGYGVTAVNLTKDKLEVQLLKRQLTNTK